MFFQTGSVPILMMLALLAAALSGCTTDDSASTYDGCHGVGCLVDDPDDDRSIDPTPQYDSQGEPNFDEEGNYIGCHGIGCEVNDPDE